MATIGGMAVALLVLLWSGDDEERQRAVRAKAAVSLVVLAAGMASVWAGTAGAKSLPTWQRLLVVSALLAAPVLRYWPNLSPPFRDIFGSAARRAHRAAGRVDVGWPLVTVVAANVLWSAFAFVALGSVADIGVPAQLALGVYLLLTSVWITRSAGGGSLWHLVPSLVLQVVLALPLAELTLLTIFNKEIEAQVHRSGESGRGLLVRVEALDQIQHEHRPWLTIAVWGVRLVVACIWVAPVLVAHIVERRRPTASRSLRRA